MRDDILLIMFIIFGIIAIVSASFVAFLIAALILFLLYTTVKYLYHLINDLYWNKKTGQKTPEQIKKELEKNYDYIHKLKLGEKEFFIAKNIGKKNRIVNWNGKMSFEYDDFDLKIFGKDNKAFFIVTENEKCGIVDWDGKIELPFEYGKLDIFGKNGEVFFIAKKEEKYGIIDLDGKTALPFEYDYLCIFVGNDEESDVVDKDADLYMIIIDYIGVSISLSSVRNREFFGATKGEKYGIVDLNGKIVVPFEYDYILEDFVKEDKVFFIVFKNDKCGIIDLNGKIVRPFEYDELHPINEGNKVFFNAKKGEKHGIIDWDGKIIMPFIHDDYISESSVKKYFEQQEEIKQQILEKERKKQEGIRKKQLEAQIKAEMMEQGIISNDDDNLREPIPQDVQDRVWNRDGGKCVKCGSQEKLEFDHIIPFSRGGSNTYRNLQILCEKCNRSKNNKIG